MYDKPGLFEEIVSLIPATVALSVYSMNPEIHDKITRVKGSWEKTISVAKKLLDRHVPVEIKSFLTKYNADDFREVFDFAFKNNCIPNVSEYLIENKDGSNLHTRITKEQQKKFYEYLYENKLRNFVRTIDDEYLNDYPCLAGQTTLHIDPNFNVTPCPSANFIFTNLRDKSLKDFWLDDKYCSTFGKFRTDKIKDYKDCFKEEYCKYCEFCPAKFLNKNARKADVCENAKFRMNIIKKYEQQLH